MSLLAWHDGVQTSLRGELERAGTVAAEPGSAAALDFGSAAGELAACVHAVGLLVTGTDAVDGTDGFTASAAIIDADAVTEAPGNTVRFELLGRRVEKVIRDLVAVRPGTRWSRPSPGRAITTVPEDEALGFWRALVEAGSRHGLANVGDAAAARFRLLESRQA